MRWLRGMLLLMAVGAGLAWAQQKGTGPGPLRGVLTDTEAFLLAPSEMIAGPQVTGMYPSPDGRYLLIRRDSMDISAMRRALSQTPAPSGPPPGERSLVLWSSRTRKSDVVWHQPIGEASAANIEQVDWLPGTDTALLVARVVSPPSQAGTGPQQSRALLLLNASRASVRTITALGERETLQVSPTQPLAVLSGENDGGSFVRVVRANGSAGAPLPLPRGASVAAWPQSRDNVVYAAAFERVETPKRHVEQRWFSLDLRNGAVNELAEAPKETATNAPAKVPDTLPIRVKHVPATLKEGTSTQSVLSAWLESATPSEQPRVLITADADGATLLPDASAVLYQSQGGLYAVSILRVDKTAFLEARRKAQQMVAMSNARQIGLGLMIYAQDYDEVFPPGGGDTMNQVMPYIKNSAVFNNPATGALGFAYTFGGGSLSSIAQPATTAIGYVTGPGGRAMIYADGHVRWEDN